MKKLWILCAFMLSMVSGFAADPAQFLPAQSDFVLYADGLRLANVFEKMNFSELKPDAQANLKALNGVLQNQSSAWSQIFSGPLFVVNYEDAYATGLFFATRVPESKMSQLAKQLLEVSGQEIVCETMQVGKHLVYTFVQAGKMPNDGNLTLCYTYLANDVVFLFFMEKEDIAEAFRVFDQFGGNAFVSKLDRSNLYSIYLDVSKNGDLANALQLGFGKFVFSVNVSGPNQKDITVAAKFVCRNAQELQTLETQINLYIPVGLGLLFGDNAELYGEVFQKINMTTSGNDLDVSIHFDEALTVRIDKYLTEQAVPESVALPELKLK